MSLTPVTDASTNQIGKIVQNDARLLVERTDYVPLRDDLFKLVSSEISRFQKGMLTRNLLLYGPAGTGKTSLVQKVIETIPRSASLKVVYVNCWLHNTRMAVYSLIAQALGEVIPRRGLSTDEVYVQLVQSVKRSGTKVVLVFDEIDGLLFNKSERLLFDISKGECAPYFCYIGVCDDPKGFTELAERTIQRLNLGQIEVKPYLNGELVRILKSKASVVLVDGAYSDSVIAACAQRADGSAWLACDALWNAALRAERHDRSAIMLEDVTEKENSGVLIEPTVKSKPKALVGLCEEEQLIISILSSGSATSKRLYREFGRKAIRTKRQIRNYLDRLKARSLIRVTAQTDSLLSFKPRMIELTEVMA